MSDSAHAGRLSEVRRFVALPSGNLDRGGIPPSAGPVGPWAGWPCHFWTATFVIFVLFVITPGRIFATKDTKGTKLLT